ncbi:P1 family peptidase [Budviciaceae bacterium BWR-B9]|uniref:P1 family peptidase n=1 Tax=Limnobaculum allomyrinae TaxID=2791986 RepID=A0ABS1ILB9_9GAMM|nr:MULTISPECIES: P1 family peptidase [Limnobaculum]MBK5142541.1 P1 family peptidase [Limnobaculum allomyrinae]MBV7690575.1 P1 family peptidase [Limnobaculum sp. M2-1]
MFNANGSIIDVPGIKVGHQQNMTSMTGCSVIITEHPSVCGVDVRGSAPGTRETDLLSAVNAVDKIHALLLSGGSAYGLDAATGIMKYLEEQHIGFDVGVGVVPIVPAAVIFDLSLGDAKIRPDAAMGYLAAQIASKNRYPDGNTGAGAGATVGKLVDDRWRMKGGLGSASITLSNGLVVAAMVVVNAVGEVRDPDTQRVIAGSHDGQGRIQDMLALMLQNVTDPGPVGTNTTIGVIACNANMNKTQMTKVAQMGHDGLARTIYPVHTMSDGDTLFALTTGGIDVSINLLGTLAAEVVARAVVNGVKAAIGVLGVPAWRDLNRE